MIRLFQILLFAAPALFGQITAITAHPGGNWTSCTGSSPTLNCTVHERKHGFEVTWLQITTTGTYSTTSTSITGPAIGLTAVWCKVNTGDLATCVTPSGADSTPVLYIGFDGYTDDNLSAGTHTGSAVSLNSGGFTINVTFIMDPQIFPIQTTPSGSCSGCSVSDAKYGALGDTVAISNITPPGNFTPPTSAGGSYTDPNFGGVVTTVVPATAVPGTLPIPVEYSDAVVTSWNSDNTLKLTTNGFGDVLIRDAITPFTLRWTNPGGTAGGGASTKWLSLEPKALVYFSGKTLRKIILDTPGNVLCDQVILPAISGTYTTYTDGGDSEVSGDDWYLFATCANTPGCATEDKKLILVNLSGHPGSCSYTAPSYTYDFSALPNFGLRNTNLSLGIDAVTGLRYLVAQSPRNGGGTAGNELLSFNGTTISDIGPFPAKTGLNATLGLYAGNGACLAAYAAIVNTCQDEEHAGTCQVNGIQGFCTVSYGRQHPTYYNIIFERFSAGLPGMAIDTAAGGGLTTILPFKSGGTHSGMARRGNVMIVSVDYVGITSWKVTNMTGNGITPIHVTSDTAYTGANGDVLTFANVGGNTALNGPKTCPVANLSGTGFDCAATTGNGTYTASTGMFYLGTQTITTGPFDMEIDIVNMPALLGSDPDVSKMTVLRHSTTRSVRFTDVYFDPDFYWQSHGNISQNGDRFGFESNYAYPDRMGVYMGFTGFTSVPPGTRQIAFVQSKSASAGASPSLTFDVNPGAGHLLAVCVSILDNTSTVTSITNTAGDSFVAGDVKTGLSGGPAIQIWYAANIAGGANSATLNLTLSGGGSARLMGHEYSGVAISSPLDGAKWANGVAGDSSGISDLGSQTTANANDVIFSCEQANGGTFSPTNSFTQREAPFNSVTSDDKVVGAAGSYDVGWTWTGAGVTWVGHAVAFKPAGGSTQLPGKVQIRGNATVR